MCLDLRGESGLEQGVGWRQLSPSSCVEEEELLMSVGSSSLGTGSPSRGAAGSPCGTSSLRGSVVEVTVWLDEASTWLSVFSSGSSANLKGQRMGSVMTSRDYF